MDELKWELLMEANGRQQADLLKSYLEAEGIGVQVFQEALGPLYGITIDGLGRVQIFVSKTQIAQARELVAAYNGHA